MKNLPTLLALLLATLISAAEPAPVFHGARPGALEKAKAAVASGDESAKKALKKLISDAEKALAVAPPSVVEKTKVPPSGDKHDYMSIAPYFWPNPATKDGLPYVRKDGKVNPESRAEAANDTLRARLVGATVETLALAYCFTGDEKYAAHAAKILRVWFLDSATKMNPNFRFAQAIPGVNDGRGTGILEARGLADAADAATLLNGSKHWSAADQRALLAWAAAYFEWLTASKNGQDERAAKNNHGTWYDVQAVKWALLLGRGDKAKEICSEAAAGRIGVQIQPDGRQPLELARTASFSYSCFNLRAWSALAGLGEHAGVELWKHRSADGRSLVAALDFLAPYLGKNPKPGTMQQIHESNDDDVLPVLRAAALATGDERYESLLKEYSDYRSKRLQLLAPR
jgi:hypothetical protein